MDLQAENLTQAGLGAIEIILLIAAIIIVIATSIFRRRKIK